MFSWFPFARPQSVSLERIERILKKNDIPYIVSQDRDYIYLAVPFGHIYLYFSSEKMLVCQANPEWQDFSQTLPTRISRYVENYHIEYQSPKLWWYFDEESDFPCWKIRAECSIHFLAGVTDKQLDIALDFILRELKFFLEDSYKKLAGESFVLH